MENEIAAEFIAVTAIRVLKLLNNNPVPNTHLGDYPVYHLSDPYEFKADNALVREDYIDESISYVDRQFSHNNDKSLWTVFNGIYPVICFFIHRAIVFADIPRKHQADIKVFAASRKQLFNLNFRQLTKSPSFRPSNNSKVISLTKERFQRL